MNLRKKKMLAAKTLGVGKKRIIFVKARIDEIKEAITKQDIRDLNESGAIMIKQISGRKKKIRINRTSVGNVRKKIKDRKKKYMILTRKLRKHLNEQGKIKKIPKEEVRKKIKNREFRNKSDLNEYLKSF